MQKLIRTFLFVSILLLCGCHSSRSASDNRGVFQKDLSEIYSQQYSIRRTQWLSSLQNEDKNANTLSSLNELELMLENPDYDNATRNKNIMQHFERAVLYMQILLFPFERETYLQNQIKKELIFELSSIFLHNTIAQNALNGLSAKQNSSLSDNWKNIISIHKIEYDTLRINEINAAEKMPSVDYPLHNVQTFRSLAEYRNHKPSPLRNASMKIYKDLSDRFREKLPLVLLKLIYRTPYELNNHYANDIQLKKDFSLLINDLAFLYKSEQHHNNMQNSFIIAEDFKKSVAGSKSPSAEMLDGCFKSQLAYENSYLKMLSEINASPFEALPILQNNIPELPQSRLETLQLIFKELLDKI